VVAQGVAGDGEEPGGETAGAIVAREPGQGLGEDGRGQILGVGALAHLPQQIAVDRADVAAVERHERLGIGAGGRHQPRLLGRLSVPGGHGRRRLARHRDPRRVFSPHTSLPPSPR